MLNSSFTWESQVDSGDRHFGSIRPWDSVLLLVLKKERQRVTVCVVPAPPRPYRFLLSGSARVSVRPLVGPFLGHLRGGPRDSGAKVRSRHEDDRSSGVSGGNPFRLQSSDCTSSDKILPIDTSRNFDVGGKRGREGV